jgi:hypothetical protein
VAAERRYDNGQAAGQCIRRVQYGGADGNSAGPRDAGAEKAGRAPAADGASCLICFEDIDKDAAWLPCIRPKCSMRAHLVCLAGYVCGAG